MTRAQVAVDGIVYSLRSLPTHAQTEKIFKSMFHFVQTQSQNCFRKISSFLKLKVLSKFDLLAFSCHDDSAKKPLLNPSPDQEDIALQWEAITLHALRILRHLP